MEEIQSVTESEKSGHLGGKLKVVLLCDEWGSSKGGLSTFNKELASHLAKRSDLEVSCFLPEVSLCDKNAAIKHNVTLIKAESIPGNREPLVNLQHWPTELPSPDVIISHSRKFGCAAYCIKREYPSCKWAHFVHVDCEQMGKNKVGDNEMSANNIKDKDELSLCEKADVVVAVGPQLFDRYIRSLPSKRKKVKVFYPGLNNEFRNLPEKNVENEKFHIYIFGRCSSEDFELKGFDLVADAVGILGEDYNVHVVGVPEGEEKNTLQHIVATTKLKKSQLFVWCYCKNREEMKEMMCEADLVVMPSRAEAFGLIGLEALSAGVPLLVSADSGLGMTLKKLNFGDTCVVKSEPSEEWAKRIELLKQKERSQRLFEVNHIRNQYEEKYKWEDQCSRLVELLWELKRYDDRETKDTTN
mgnify:CR=1 FL=1